ncbi:uncharacterized protein LOC110462523 isoform X2 [Mizuhopecten yessoensis]|nr:uncharacterized protein LOC110462523 isoform X2 [Mizuhopecten yessoensis]XP_021372182.1 uncharacterized protein LOC110462523 isoform X2 [Mizuhopecten yessoensis]XP_021372183.1 uncharacterized protein LOC110462523 isoform X2 [Mizuhopecten yessoensis]
MMVKINPQDKDGKIYIHEVHTTQTSVFRPGDELVALDSELINDFTVENIQGLFSFETDASEQRVKNVTIKRTEDLENGAAGETEELDVEVAIVTDMISIRTNEHARWTRVRFPRPQRQRHQKRRVQWVKTKRGGVQQVFIQTNNSKYLTVRNGGIVGDNLGTDNMDDFTFHLEPMVAAYSKALRRSKVVICCKIRWKSFWVKTVEGSDGELGMELSDDDTDDHLAVFKRRVKSDGRFGTGFECLLFKNVYLQYIPQQNKVDIKPYNPRGDFGTTLRFVPASTLFRVISVKTSSTSNLLYSPNDTSPRFSAHIDEFEAAEGTTGCCSKCFGFFKHHKSRSDRNESISSYPTIPSTDIASRADTEGPTN